MSGREIAGIILIVGGIVLVRFSLWASFPTLFRIITGVICLFTGIYFCWDIIKGVNWT